jgi:hypothetical protein
LIAPVLLYVGLSIAATVLATVPSLAQTDGAQEASINLTDVRFDADRNAYLFDLAFTGHEAIETVQLTLWNENNVVISRETFSQPGPARTVALDASQLLTGQTYRVEVLAFAADGSPLVTAQRRPVSVEQEFVHDPNQTGVRIENPLFALDRETGTLVITLDTVDGQEIAAYRVILKEKGSNVVALDTQVIATSEPVISVPLGDLPEGQYLVVVQAQNAAGTVLSSVQDVFAYQLPAPVLGEPLFRFDHAGPTLQVSLQTQNRERIWNYRVTLIDKESNQALLVHYEEAESAPPIDVPLAELPGGEYQVVIEALGNANRVLDSVTGQTVYEPPPPPGFGQRMLAGLRARPWIPIAIGSIGLLLAGGLVWRGVAQKRATATPVLQQRGLRAAKGDGLSLSHTLEGAKPAQRKTQPRRASGPPRLTITIEATPEGRLVGEQVAVGEYPFTLGRGDCHLDLSTDAGVSRLHAELRYSQRGLYIMDMLSSNGTYVNGERIAAETPVLLDPTQETHIRLGSRTQLVLAP